MKLKFRRFRLGETSTLCALVILLISGIYYAFSNYVGFDEAFNLQIPTNLVQHGQYGTSYDGGKLFDPVISTGPTVLLPIAAAFKLFGVGINSARLIACFYCCMAILLLAWISYQLGGWLATLLLITFVSFLPNFFEFGFRVMGEIPGLAFFLIGMLGISRKKSFLGGFFLGLSTLAKLNFSFSLGPLAIFYGVEWFGASNTIRKAIFHSLLQAVFGFFLPLMVWESISLASLGASGYWKALTEFLSLMGLIPGPRRLILASSFLSRLRTIGSPYGISYGSIILIGVTLLGGLMLWAMITNRSSMLPTTSNMDGKLYWLLNVSGATYLGLWLIIGPSDLWRYLMPVYIIWGLIVSVAFGRWLAGMRMFPLSAWTVTKYMTLFIVLALVFVYPPILHFRSVQLGFKQTYTCQVELADHVRQMSSQKALFGYWGWFQSPEISFLSEENFYDIANPKTRTNLLTLKAQGYQLYVIVSWVQESAAASTLTDESPFLGKLTKQACGFKIYNYVDAQAR